MKKNEGKRMNKRQIFHLMAGRDAETRGTLSYTNSNSHTRRSIYKSDAIN